MKRWKLKTVVTGIVLLAAGMWACGVRGQISQVPGGTILLLDTLDGVVTVALGIGEPFIDSRDGKIYKTVVIHTKTWMAENLNYQTDNSWCYDDEESNCNKYGRLYTWDAAMKACHEGWHLPSNDLWELRALVPWGGKELKSKTGWKNDGGSRDTIGFSALPGGIRYINGRFNYAGYYGRWWTSEENGADDAYSMSMGYHYESVGIFKYNKDYGYSVRCIKK